MKLNVKYNSKKKSGSIKKKNTESSKKNKGPKLLKNYKDNSEYIYDNIELDLTKMRYGVIGSCNVDALILPEGTIKIENSWVEVLLVMLDTLISQGEFQKKLEIYGITNQFFCVDTVYGKYTFEGEQFKAYKIFDSGYYLEAVFSNENIFNAIVGLTKALDITLDGIKFHLRNKKDTRTELRFNILEERESIVNIGGLADKLKAGIHMVSMNIDGTKTIVHRIDVALVVFCKWILENVRSDIIEKIESVGKTRICKSNNVKKDEKNTKITEEYSVCTSGNEDEIIEFIDKTMKTIGLEKNQLEFKFRA